MRGDMPLPVWAIALVLAAFAPFGAKMLATLFQRMARSRSREWLSKGARRSGVEPS